jgi:hypothetical protein
MSGAAEKRAQKSGAEKSAGVNGRRILTWFIRVLAIAWFLKGLAAWALILGVDPGSGRPFDERANTYQAIIIFFAVADIVASVGLWLLAPWGGVVWLTTASTRVALTFVVPPSIGLTQSAAAAVGVCVIAFLLMSWLAGRQGESG